MLSPDTTTELPSIAHAPDGLQDHTKASAFASYKAAGYSDKQLNDAGYGAPPVTTSQTVVPTPGGGVYLRNDGISHDQAVSAAKHLIEHGVDPAIVAAAALSHGLLPEEFNVKPSPQEVAASQREAETAKGFEPPAPEERYQLEYREVTADAAALVSLDKEYQSAFKSAGVPKGALAQSLVDALQETKAKYADEGMTDDAKAMIWRDEGTILRHGVRDITEHSRLAAIGYAALPKAFRDQLDAGYALHSARAQIQLEHLGRAIEYRKGK